MNEIKEKELIKLSEFMIEQFFEKEEMQQMFQGFDTERAKKIAIDIACFELTYLNERGNVYIYDDAITAAIVGIEAKKLFTIKRLVLSFKANKILKQLTNEEFMLLKKNMKLIKEVHNIKWFKKNCKNPFYIVQFAVDKNKRGQGIAREMLEELFQYVSVNNDYIVLETLTESNVPIYEHFGFETMEVYETKNKELKEYRMLKRMGAKNNKNVSFGKLS